MKAILAGNYQQYRQYLHDFNLSPKDAVFADRPEKIMGMEFDEVIHVGTWSEYPDAQYIEVIAKSRTGRT